MGWAAKTTVTNGQRNIVATVFVGWGPSLCMHYHKPCTCIRLDLLLYRSWSSRSAHYIHCGRFCRRRGVHCGLHGTITGCYHACSNQTSVSLAVNSNTDSCSTGFSLLYVRIDYLRIPSYFYMGNMGDAGWIRCDVHNDNGSLHLL